MAEAVEFEVPGATLRGRLFRPAGTGAPVPLIVMSPGLTQVIDMSLDRFAESFAEAGLAALLYDQRNFGLSGGEPRQEADPWLQVHDMRDAITFARRVAGIDPDRIGLWGTSYSGGHALVVGALDRRVKCVVAQAPLISGYRTLQSWLSPEELAALAADCLADRDARGAGAAPVMTPVAEPGSVEAAWVAATDPSGAFVNGLTLRSRELIFEYEPEGFVARIAPTPVLMIVASRDVVTPADGQRAAFALAGEPKRLVEIDCGHFDVYSSHLDGAVNAAREWFCTHLTGAQP